MNLRKSFIALCVFSVIAGVLGAYAFMFPLIQLPVAGALLAFAAGAYATAYLQYKQPENARLYLRTFSLPGAGVLLLIAWLVSLARHREIISLLKY